MHPRTRSPGNGYRSNSMGMSGVATATRISPESSIRGQGGYNSDYRSYSRGGFGRGQSKQFQRSQLPPQKGGDIFIEAGRLATEFLVSKGLLPANVLSGKWQNDNFKNQAGSQEGDSVHNLEGRTSALSRLGGPVADIGPGHRRYPDEYNSIGSRSYTRGRRRNGSFKNYGSDWGREFGRSGSWSEKSRASADAEGDSDTSSRNLDEQQVSNVGDGASQNFRPELAPESDVGDPESALDKHRSGDDAGAKASSSSNSKDSSMDAGVEPPEKADVSQISHIEAGEIKDGENNDAMELQDFKNDQVVGAGTEEDKIASENSSDLLKLWSFAKIPTRPRSSVANKGSKVDDPRIVDKNMHDSEHPKESQRNVEDSTIDSLSRNDLSKHPCVSKIVDSSTLKAEAAEDGSGITYDLTQRNSRNSISFLERSSVKEETNELSAFGRSSAVMDQGEKRALDENFTVKASKRPRVSAASEDAQADGCLHILDSEKQQAPPAPIASEVQAVTLPSDEKRLLDISLYPKGDIQPCMEYTEEKELFPGSFKTCDLNLMEASDANENHENDPILIFPPIPANGKQAVPVEIDLTMSNNSHVPDKYGKDIEVIDLENDSVQEDKGFNNVQRRTDNVFPGLDGYSSNAHNANDIPDTQDGYGLMFSELLGNDIPNCSSVPPDMNPLHNDMGLHNGEGILGDDESIYMSLGEIPLSLLRAWEQPSQDYGKPF